MDYTEPREEYRLNPFWVRAVATALARQHNVSVRRGDRWALDMEDKVLVYTDQIEYLDENNALALLLHEIGHLRFSEKFDTTTKIAKEYPNASHNCINAVEDLRIDNIMGREYEGSFALLDTLDEQTSLMGLKKLTEYQEAIEAWKGDCSHYKRALGKAKRQGDQEEVDYIEDKLKVTEANKPHLGNVKEVMFLSLMIHGGFGEHKVVREYHNTDFVERARKCAEKFREHSVEDLASTKEVQDFYEAEIFPIIKDIIDPKDEEDHRNSFIARANAGKIQSIAADELRGDGEAEALGEKIEGHGQQPGDQMPDAPHPVDYSRYVDDIKSLIAGSTARFKRILRDNSFDRYGGRYKTGKINAKRLYKQRLKDYRLFERPTERQNKDYAFSIMIDLSGSMDGRRLTESMKGLALLTEVMRGCDVPTEVRFFSGAHSVGKTFDEPLSRRKMGSKAGEVWGGGTNIYTPFKEAFERLAARPERHKVMVVLTDGMVYHEDGEQMRQDMSRVPDIHSYGIGVGVDLADIFERNALNVSDAGDIIHRFGAILKRHIKTG